MNFGRLLIALLFFANQLAQAQSFAPLKKGSMLRDGNEFYVGQEVGQPLVTVNLLSGVRQPGVYHVPTTTDIAQLISYAGGTTDNADISDVILRRQSGKDTRTLVSFDLEKQLKSSQSLTILQDQDVIHIANKTTMDNTMKWVAIISGLASVALSVVLINDIESR